MRLFFLFFFINQAVLAQTTSSVGVSISLPSIALLDIAPNAVGVNLDLATPTELGNSMSVKTKDNTKWLNFTSAVPIGTTRSISVYLSGTLPSGLNLQLATANYVGSGEGALGYPTPLVYLTTKPQMVVNNIGGSYTGNGLGNGYNLTYNLEISDYSLLRAGATTLSIIYTLTDN